MNEIEKYLLSRKPTQCQVCQDKLFHIGSGQYKCRSCESVEYDDFGKIKALLDEKGSLPIYTISELTGVSMETIEFLLKDGQVELTENSKYFLDCGKCGCSIRSGRFCIDCATELAKGVQRIFYNEVGEKAKIQTNAKMHFLHTRKK